MTPGGALRAAGANPGAWSRGGRGFPETRGRRPEQPERGAAEPGLPGAGQGSACSGDRLWDPRVRGPQRLPRRERGRGVAYRGAYPREAGPGRGDERL